MDINGFLAEVLQELSQYDFVAGVDFHVEVIIIKGRVLLKKEPYFVEVYFNEISGTMAFALIANEKRLWGIDHDNIRKWHEHPLENPDTHKTLSEKSISGIIKELHRIFMRL